VRGGEGAAQVEPVGLRPCSRGRVVRDLTGLESAAQEMTTEPIER
jgi:hypothetical protein